MIFLSSLPRSGSTLLTSLLNQRPDVYVTPTSNLCDTVGAAVTSWEQNPTTQAQGGTQVDLLRIIEGIMANRYDTDKLVFDKGRMWAAPQIVQTMSMIQDVKIVATVRPIADCLASFAKIAKPDDMEAFCKGRLAQHLMTAYQAIKACHEQFPDKILLVEYDNLVTEPQTELDRIADFVGIERVEVNANEVADSGEDDKAWGIKDLHKVRGRVKKANYSPKRLLGKKLYNFYQGGEFWNDNPEPVRKKQPIQKQHDALMAGDFELSKKLAYKNLEDFPNDPDISFNAGWAKLSDGKVSEGYRLLDKGRETTVWGDPFQSIQPTWKRGDKGTVLLRLERGLGDQIHHVRYARDLKAAGCTVVVSCQSQLAELLTHAEGVDVVVQHEAAAGVYHDYFLPAMSAPIQLEYQTNDNISGKSYIRVGGEVVQGRIGLRWSGNPEYEHATKRQFPHDLMFNAVAGRDCISLQRDEGSELRPRSVEAVCLDTWIDTAKAISSCELVITSCTSVAHLAGAMGVPTWCIVPVVPYYLWTTPGVRTPYYNSMMLFRQENADNWEQPFAAIWGELDMVNAA